MLHVLFFLGGLIVGSFLNVVICRLPAGDSLVLPASLCPECRQRLAWYELVPVLSYLWQRGKCRHCGTAISLQYPLVELATGAAYLGLFLLLGLQPKLLTSLMFISLCIPIVVIDLDRQIIPDQLNLGGAVLGLLAAAVSHTAFTDVLAGGLAGGVIMLLIAIVSRGGMGGGDIKMMAWIGLFLGLKMTMLALFLSFVIGGLASLILILAGRKRRKDFIPFGPFLAAGGFTAYVFGPAILAWYVQNFLH
ncbi:MAG TPA: prepilin peptidase [Firmicutes bacterium]|nr:prepilin peptidase [Bacillota bacterium]